MEARTFHRESDLSLSTQAIQFTKHLIPGQTGTLKHHFFELTAWGTNDDFHGVLPLRLRCAPLVLLRGNSLCMLNATMGHR